MSTQLTVVLVVLAALVAAAVYFKLFARLADWWQRSRVFLKETRAELAKVTFPSRDDVVATTIVVIIASVVFAVFLTLSDVVINRIYGVAFNFFGS